VVATSGNLEGRPIARTLAEAREQLGEIADALLVHDRPIHRRCDDSVAQVVAGELRVLRLGRGFAPASVELPVAFAELPPMLGLGAQLAHAPVLAVGTQAIAWPHVGDLDEPHTRAAMLESIEDLSRVLGCTPATLVVDAHPDYASGLGARAQPQRRCVAVHHHHAHVAAVLAEHGRDAALGVAWDGAGLGVDRTIWGGEFLLVDPRGARRVAHLRPFPLPGGDAAARDGLRPLAGMLASAELDAPADPKLARLIALARKRRLAPSTSSVGRMFDAVAALTGVCRRSRYQAEAAQALEHAASPDAPPYEFGLHAGELDWRPMLAAMLEQREAPDVIASRFHATLIAMILRVAEAQAQAQAQTLSTIVLAGGCFANRRLLAGALAALRARGFEALAARRLPPGDGGLGLGQVWVAGQLDARGLTAPAPATSRG
jgi:hydrogenase maturation protein HypF